MPQFDLFELFHQFFYVFWAFIYTFLFVEGFLLPTAFKVIKSRRFCTEILPDQYLIAIQNRIEFCNFFLLSKLTSCRILLKGINATAVSDEEIESDK